MGGTPSHHPSSRGVSIINHPTVGVPLITFLQFLLSKMGWKSPGPLGNQQSYPSRFLKLRVWSVWYRMHSVNFFEPMELGSGTPKNIRLHTKSSLIKKFWWHSVFTTFPSLKFTPHSTHVDCGRRCHGLETNISILTPLDVARAAFPRHWDQEDQRSKGPGPQEDIQISSSWNPWLCFKSPLVYTILLLSNLIQLLFLKLNQSYIIYFTAEMFLSKLLQPEQYYARSAPFYPNFGTPYPTVEFTVATKTLWVCRFVLMSRGNWKKNPRFARKSLFRLITGNWNFNIEMWFDIIYGAISHAVGKLHS